MVKFKKSDGPTSLNTAHTANATDDDQETQMVPRNKRRHAIKKVMEGTMEHRGYTATFDWIKKEGRYSSEVLDTWGIVGFVGNTLEETRKAFTEVFDWHLDICEKDNQEPRLSNREAMAHSI